MILWVVIIGAMFTVAILGHAWHHELPFNQAMLVPLLAGLFIGVLMPVLFSAINAPHINSEPWCDHTVHHVEVVRAFEPPETTAHDLAEHLWQNVTIHRVPAGGLFGGTDAVVWGECP